MLQVISPLTPLEILLQTIFREYLISSYCLTVVSEKPLNFPVDISFTYIALKDGEIFPEQLLEVSENGCSDYVVQMEEPTKFMEAFEMVNHMGNVRRSDRKIVFVPYSDGLATIKHMLQILSLKETSFVANILLILPSEEESSCSYYDLVTHKFVGPENETAQPYYLDKWDTTSLKFENNANLFPHNMENLHGKIVKVACFTYKPYILLDLDKTQAPLGRDGTEVRIVDEFCR